ncbi:UNKNOWN [Stylonychia lemnae]|uniref:Uncharacterized protein n=1 Tax=Stylonychia lemnae TaxID=5949 RepID=A0A078A5L0_STYLE|nr:UNKNOWN [Stylonychia lemnae]|eukprot:CDW77525.1 UNKNOWN [Stylonychia lemnae]
MLSDVEERITTVEIDPLTKQETPRNGSKLSNRQQSEQNKQSEKNNDLKKSFDCIKKKGIKFKTPNAFLMFQIFFSQVLAKQVSAAGTQNNSMIIENLNPYKGQTKKSPSSHHKSHKSLIQILNGNHNQESTAYETERNLILNQQKDKTDNGSKLINNFEGQIDLDKFNFQVMFQVMFAINILAQIKQNITFGLEEQDVNTYEKICSSYQRKVLGMNFDQIKQLFFQIIDHGELQCQQLSPETLRLIEDAIKKINIITGQLSEEELEQQNVSQNLFDDELGLLGISLITNENGNSKIIVEECEEIIGSNESIDEDFRDEDEMRDEYDDNQIIMKSVNKGRRTGYRMAKNNTSQNVNVVGRNHGQERKSLSQHKTQTLPDLVNYAIEKKSNDIPQNFIENNLNLSKQSVQLMGGRRRLTKIIAQNILDKIGKLKLKMNSNSEGYQSENASTFKKSLTRGSNNASHFQKELMLNPDHSKKYTRSPIIRNKESEILILPGKKLSQNNNSVTEDKLGSIYSSDKYLDKRPVKFQAANSLNTNKQPQMTHITHKSSVSNFSYIQDLDDYTRSNKSNRNHHQPQQQKLQHSTFQQKANQFKNVMSFTKMVMDQRNDNQQQKSSNPETRAPGTQQSSVDLRKSNQKMRPSQHHSQVFINNAYLRLNPATNMIQSKAPTRNGYGTNTNLTYKQLQAGSKSQYRVTDPSGSPHRNNSHILTKEEGFVHMRQKVQQKRREEELFQDINQFQYKINYNPTFH